MRFFTVVLLSFLFSAPVKAQTLLKLDDAIMAALEHNHGILISRERLLKLENDKTIGNAGMLPTIGLDASRNFSITDVNQTFQDGRKLENNGIKANNYTLASRLEWTLFDGFEMFMKYDRLDQLRRLGSIQLRAEVEGTLADVIIAYYNLGRQQKLARFQQESIEISQQRLKIAEDKLDVGSGARVEVLQAQVALNDDRSALKNQMLQLYTTRENLSILMGSKPGTEFSVDEKIDLDSNLSFDTILGSARANNLELITQRLVLSISRQQTNIAKAQRLPTLSLNTSYTFTGSENRAGFFVEQNNQGFNYGITARVPLFNGLNLSRTVQNARIEEKINQIEMERIELKLESNILRVYTEYITALELIKLENENVMVAKENAAIALDRFQLGTYTPVELREAQRSLLNTEIRLASAMYAAKSSEIQLKYVSGLLDDSLN
jgi:outer membrane protein